LAIEELQRHTSVLSRFEPDDPAAASETQEVRRTLLVGWSAGQCPVLWEAFMKPALKGSSGLS
jgi:hypothetical protein